MKTAPITLLWIPTKGSTRRKKKKLNLGGKKEWRESILFLPGCLPACFGVSSDITLCLVQSPGGTQLPFVKVDYRTEKKSILVPTMQKRIMPALRATWLVATKMYARDLADSRLPWARYYSRREKYTADRSRLKLDGGRTNLWGQILHKLKAFMEQK